MEKAASTANSDKPATFWGYRDLLASRDVEAVYSATPCDLHEEIDHKTALL